MSCRLVQKSKIAHLEKIKIFLNNQDHDLVSEGKSQDGQDDSGKNCSYWLSDCLLAISPTNELLALAKDKRAVFLSRKNILKSDDGTPLYNELSWQGELSYGHPECVTSLLCVPLASQQRSSQGWPDWSCVITGFTSGFIKIYMQNGELLISQFLHDSPVVSMNLRTNLTLDSSSFDQVEELTILYSKAVVVIDGFSLYQALRACRSQLAKALASNFQEVVQPPSLAYRKWRLDGQNEIFDIVNCGMVNPCLFDRLTISSFQIDAPLKLRGSASGPRRIISSGKNPFIGWYELVEESSSPLISDVALTVASQLTTAVISKISNATGDWLGFGSKLHPQRKDTRPPRHIEFGTNARLSYGLPDKRRRAESIVLSPNDSLAACTDDFGRILLIASESGLIVRMLKGYRDAQCGFLLAEEQVDEDNGVTKRRQALFLVVYARRRGILEIWLAEQGPRVSAFAVGKDCRLIYNRYGVLGNSGKNMRESFKGFHQCFLVRNNGEISTISVPFHCSLSLLHSVKLRDGYLLKKIVSILERKIPPVSKGDPLLLDQFVTYLVAVFHEIEIPDSQLRAILHVLSCDKLPANVLKLCISAISEVIVPQAMGEGGDIKFKSETRALLSFCSNQIEMINLYSLLAELHASNNTKISQSEICQEPKVMVDLLHLSDEEASTVQEAFDKLNVPPQGCLFESNSLTVSRFLRAFRSSVDEQRSDLGLDRIAENDVPNLLEDIPFSQKLATFFFKPMISMRIPVAELDFLLNSQCISLETLMELLAIFTQTGGAFFDKSYSTVIYVHSLAKAIFNSKDKLNPRSSISLFNWWQPVRDLLDSSTFSPQGLVMAFICRNISLTAELAKEQNDVENDSWEEVERDKKEWKECIERLIDLAVLWVFLHIGQFNDAEPLPLTSCCPKLSVKGILNSEAGSITQIVATHLVQRRVPGPCIRDLYFNSHEEPCADSELHNVLARGEKSDILEAIKMLQIRFPNSLETEILLAHCCWECIISWKTDIEDISNLSSAVLHLSCISNSYLKRGLAFMLWKAVYRESIKTVYDLIEKVGKCPKDRLCRKHTGMSITAVEKYLLTAQNLLQFIFELDCSNGVPIAVREEPVWHNSKRSGVSIIENAMDEPECEIYCIKAMLSLVATLRLIVLTGMKGKRPSELFDAENVVSLMQSFPVSVKVPVIESDSMSVSRRKFCTSALSLLVGRYTNKDDLENDEDAIISVANDAFQLGKLFGLQEDVLLQHFACQLFLAGFDCAGNEAALSVHDKTALVQPLLAVSGSRLAVLLIESSDSATFSTLVSCLPTHITSWLQSQNTEKVMAPNDSIDKNIQLLNRILSFSAANCEGKNFIMDLIESLELFATTQ